MECCLSTPSGYKNCEHINFHFAFDYAHIAAMLWCGVPEDQLQDHLSKASEIRSGVYDIAYMPCLKLRCQLIHTAIDQGNLPVCRENGIPVSTGELVAKGRRHIRRQDLKEWISLYFENDKPSFLFDEIERNTHSLITKDAYDVLKADNDASKIRLSNAETWAKEHKQKYNELLTEAENMRSCIEKMTSAESQVISETEQEKLLKQIGALAILLSKKNNTYKKSSDEPNISQIAIAVDEMLGFLPDANIKGLSNSSLRASITEGLALLHK